MQYQDPVHALANVDKELKIRTTAHKSICIKATELCLIDLEEEKKAKKRYIYSIYTAKLVTPFKHNRLFVMNDFFRLFSSFVSIRFNIFNNKKKCKSYRVEKDKI